MTPFASPRCPDCESAEPVIDAALASIGEPVTMLYCPVVRARCELVDKMCFQLSVNCVCEWATVQFMKIFELECTVFSTDGMFVSFQYDLPCDSDPLLVAAATRAMHNTPIASMRSSS
jgi:hypothetical protein